MRFSDPSELAEWLTPHSIKWYEQLSEIEGVYKYPWHSLIMEPNGEIIFDEEAVRLAAGKKVLDAGCGPGDFTFQCGRQAKEIVGFDVTARFIENAQKKAPSNIRFVVGNAKQGLPFKTGEFDVAYNRKGPTSAYPELLRVVKKGGEILGLHPGDGSGKELPELFPGLFKESKGTPIADHLQRGLSALPFSECAFEEVTSTEYLEAPLDVIKYRCFGQAEEVFNKAAEENLSELEQIFRAHATEKGLAISYSRYLIRAKV
ncbi:class I SAM-dependent methyltransferase [Planomicrobium chinense]|uniref:class I SAM-dependent methyltransferase n=1 Tax=Planococcus chinensis TaxID=272917 RepID=UPI001CC6FA68|nr:class I SAM-dependent methyltransferase [Planococcus chinensis]MBZ5201086.1 class I SAM-dependent methyltransferase [Planococcus chinensis]